MTKQAISVTLRPENLLWLRGRAQALRQRSVSEALDQLISEARTGSRAEARAIRSVVGTVRIASSDPSLSGADAAISALFPGASGGTAKRRAAGRARSRGGRPRARA
jgi:hypothetical protein